MMVVIAAVAVLFLLEFGARAIEPGLSGVSPWGQIGIEYAVDDLESAPSGALVLLGSSAVRRGIDPSLLAFSSTSVTAARNAAFDAASPRTVALFVEEVMLPRSEPSTVVVGVSTHDLNDTGLVQATTLARYSESPARLDAVNGLSTSGRIALELGELSTLVRVRDQLRSPTAMWTAATQGGSPARRPVGYETGGPFDNFWTEQMLTDYTIGGLETQSLRRLAASLAAEANVVFVDMPIMESDLARLHPNGRADIEGYRSQLRSIGDELGIVVLWANSMPWDRDSFADPAHLNAVGAERLTRWLAAELDRITAD